MQLFHSRDELNTTSNVTEPHIKPIFLAPYILIVDLYNSLSSAFVFFIKEKDIYIYYLFIYYFLKFLILETLLRYSFIFWEHRNLKLNRILNGNDLTRPNLAWRHGVLTGLKRHWSSQRYTPANSASSNSIMYDGDRLPRPLSKHFLLEKLKVPSSSRVE